jgi:hypothetical protein
MYWYRLALAVLAIWRVTHLLVAEDGPYRIFARLRAFLSSANGLLDCFYCLSLWLAAPLAWFLGAGWLERILLWPAISAVAILLERATAPAAGVPTALYKEDEA